MEAVSFQAANPSVPAFPVRVKSPWQEAKFSGNLLLLAVGIGVALEIYGPSWIQSVFKAVALHGLRGITALLTAGLAAIIFHEAGHLIAALLMNFKVVGVALGPLGLYFPNRNWTIKFSGALTRASVSAVPPHAGNWRKQTLVVVASGPLATLITGLIAGLAFAFSPLAGWPKEFLAALTVLSFFLFVLGLLPNSPEARARNDARMFLNCLGRQA